MAALIDGLDNWSSLGGLGVSIVGFGMTLWLLVRSKTAADAAREGAAQAVEGIRTVGWLVDFSSIHHDLETAKVLMRQRPVDGLPEQFSGLRRHLIRVRALVREEGGLGERELHEAIKFCSTMELKFEKGRAEKTPVEVTDRDRATLNDQIDRIIEPTVRVQMRLARGNEGGRRW